MADIELVVKIPENTYKQIQALVRNGYFEYDICGNSMRRIANGTPLPKGHGRLIDADNIISKICGSSCGCHLKGCGYEKPCYSVTRIESAPTIIEKDKEQEDDRG